MTDRVEVILGSGRIVTLWFVFRFVPCHGREAAKKLQRKRLSKKHIKRNTVERKDKTQLKLFLGQLLYNSTDFRAPP